MHPYFLNPIASPETDMASGALVILGVVFLIAAIVSVINFAVRSADKPHKDETDNEDE